MRLNNLLDVTYNEKLETLEGRRVCTASWPKREETRDVKTGREVILH